MGTLMIVLICVGVNVVQGADDLASVVSSYMKSNVALTALKTYNCWLKAAEGTGCGSSTPQSLENLITGAITSCEADAKKQATAQQVATFKYCADKQLGEYASNLKKSSEQVKSCTGKSDKTCS